MYDSKLNYGVSFKYEGKNAVRGKDFSGGEKTVAQVLEKLGFTVLRSKVEEDENTYLVLVENEGTFDIKYDHWQDETGVR